jgi:autotransporter-associated beta strand protein
VLTGGTFSLPAIGFGNAVTLDGVITGPAANSLTLVGPITLGANSIINAGNGITLDGVVSDGNNGYSLTLAGGTTTLNNSNTYSGGTLFSGGSAVINTATAFGSSSSALVFGTSASITPNVALTLSNPITLANNATVTVAAGGVLTLSGSTITTYGVSTISDADTSGVYFNEAITGPGSMTISGAGAAFLNTTNNFTGGLTISNTGLVAIGTAGALVTPSSTNAAWVTVTGGAILADNSTVAGAMTISNPLNIAGNFTVTGNNPVVFNGSQLTMTSASTLTVLNTTTISSPIGNNSSFALTVAGFGTLNLNSADFYGGGTVLNMVVAAQDGIGGIAGTIVIGNNNAFGTGTISGIATAGVFLGTIATSAASSTLANAITFTQTGDVLALGSSVSGETGQHELRNLERALFQHRVQRCRDRGQRHVQRVGGWHDPGNRIHG